MAVAVSITVVGRTYEISCDEGQEDYVRALAAEVDRRAADLLRSVGQVGDARLLVMVALLMADEIGELQRRAARPPAVPGSASSAAPGEDEDAALAEVIAQLARRIDAIADRFEKA